MQKSKYFSLILGAAYLTCVVWLFVFKAFMGFFFEGTSFIDVFWPLFTQFYMVLSLIFVFFGVQYLLIGALIQHRKQACLSWNFYLMLSAFPLAAYVPFLGLKLVKLLTLFVVMNFFPVEGEHLELLKGIVFVNWGFAFGLAPALMVAAPQILLRRVLRS